MSSSVINYLNQHSSNYPSVLIDRLRNDAPKVISYIGNIELLSLVKIGFFCSKNVHGKAILHILDKIAEYRDTGKCVISGFHSPIEKECLKILMRGNQPIIICVAKAIERMKIPISFQDAFQKNRLLFLSPFTDSPHRINHKSSMYRNKIVSALCDEAFIGFVGKGSNTEEIIKLMGSWNIKLNY